MKIKVVAETKYVGSRDSKIVTIDDEDLEGMDDKQREAYLEEVARETLWDIIQWDWQEA